MVEPQAELGAVAPVSRDGKSSLPISIAAVALVEAVAVPLVLAVALVVVLGLVQVEEEAELVRQQVVGLVEPVVAVATDLC